MPKFFVQEKQVNKGIITIEGKDVNHIKNVLRKKEKDEIEICIMPENKEERGKDTISEILEIKEESIKCKIKEYEEKDVEGNIEVTIFQGLPKSDKMELVIQKSTELGVHQIYPVEMKRCVVKLKGKDEEKKVARWQKISEVAAKQCGRSIIPQIKEITTIESICRNIQDFNKVIVAYEEEKEKKLKTELKQLKEILKADEVLKIAIVIGPEGGIDYSEIEQLEKAGASIVTLGKRILRTETVALNVLSNIMYEFTE